MLKTVGAFLKTLKKNDANYIKVICGGVIPPQDFAKLLESGAVGVFGPGTVISEAASELIDKLNG